MAVLAFNESVASRSMAIDVGEGFKYTRSFLVQVDLPSTPMIDIVRAIGVGLWAPHPEDYFSRAQKFDVKPRGSSLLLYEVTVNYDRVPSKDEDRKEQKPGDDPDAEDEPQIPKPQWSGGTSSTTAPFTEDADGKAVTNSAGVPFPDAEKNVPSPTLSCVRAYPSYTAMAAAVRGIVGKVNGAAWAGGERGEWLCESSRWSWKTEGTGNNKLRYIECSFEFALREDGWAQMLLDVGYQQKVDDKGNPSAGGAKLGPILGGDGKPVKEPVGLDGNGVAMNPAPSPTRPPLVINGGKGAMPYKQAAFQGVVGSPS